MKSGPWIVVTLLLSGCSSDSVSDDERYHQLSCTNDNLTGTSDLSADPGPLSINAITVKPTGIITDENQLSLIGTGLVPDLIESRGFYSRDFFLSIRDDSPVDCDSGSGYSETSEYYALKTANSNAISYIGTDVVLDNCVSTILEPQGRVLTVDGKSSTEFRSSSPANSICKYTMDGYSLMVESMEDESLEWTSASTGSYLSSYSSITQKTTISFDRIYRSSAHGSSGTFRLYTVVPIRKYGNRFESGSWVIEDANGATIEFYVTTNVENSAMVTARGVALGEYEL